MKLKVHYSHLESKYQAKSKAVTRGITLTHGVLVGAGSHHHHRQQQQHHQHPPQQDGDHQAVPIQEQLVVATHHPVLVMCGRHSITLAMPSRHRGK